MTKADRELNKKRELEKIIVDLRDEIINWKCAAKDSIPGTDVSTPQKFQAALIAERDKLRAELHQARLDLVEIRRQQEQV